MTLAAEARAVRERVIARLVELEPLAREYAQLRELLVEMGYDPDAVAAGARTGAQPASKRPGTPVAVGSVPRQRIVEAVRRRPGSTVAEYAAELELPAARLYRPVRELVGDGTLVKRGRRLFDS